MKHKLVRIVIGVPAAFNALSAIGGGIALLAGTYKDGVLIEAGGQARFPLEWLQDTAFSDYTIPALILTIGVGGSSLIAATLVFTGRAEGILVSAVAGLVMAGFIIGEVKLLRQGNSWIEGLYFGLGLGIAGLATSFWMTVTIQKGSVKGSFRAIAVVLATVPCSREEEPARFTSSTLPY